MKILNRLLFCALLSSSAQAHELDDEKDFNRIVVVNHGDGVLSSGGYSPLPHDTDDESYAIRGRVTRPQKNTTSLGYMLKAVQALYCNMLHLIIVFCNEQPVI